MSIQGTVSAKIAQGPRPYQEDRYLVHSFSLADGLSGYLLAVMDGHGGSETADLCRDLTPGIFHLTGPETLEASLRKVVAGLDEQTRQMHSGTTVSLVCVLESHRRAAVAVIGDSPVIAVDRDGQMIISPEHNVRTNLEEREQAQQRGGIYEAGYIRSPRTGEGLQMARALGDCGLDDILSREPTVYAVDLGPQSVIVLATDGVFDPSHAQSDRLIEEMMGLTKRPGAFDANTLIDWADRRGLMDNATAVVWKATG
jgi:serine/threonine protein phosphatase PrpC